MAKAQNLSERERSFIEWVTGWMLQTAVFDPALLRGRDVLPALNEKQRAHFEFLIHKGCDPVMLYDSLGMVRPLQEALPQIWPRKLVSLVRSHSVPIIIGGGEQDSQTTEASRDDRQVPAKMKEDPSKRKARIIVEGTAGDLHVTPQLKEDLERKIAGYRELALSTRDEMVPRRDRLKQLCMLLQARYVHRQTGRAYFTRVSRLLDWASGCSHLYYDLPATKLSRDYKAAAKYLPWFDLLLENMRLCGYSPAIRSFKDSDECIHGVELPADASSEARRRSRDELVQAVTPQPRRAKRGDSVRRA